VSVERRLTFEGGGLFMPLSSGPGMPAFGLSFEALRGPFDVA
jgi:hypothetical protein